MKGTITRRGKSSWRLKFELERDAISRKRQTRYVTFRGTRKQAEAEIIRLMNDANHGTYIDPSKLTLAQFFEQWDRDWAALNLSPKTLERYRELVRLQITPRIGQERVQKLRPSHLQNLYATLQREGSATGHALSARTVGHVHRVLHRALGHAVTWGIIAANPVSSVEPPPVPPTEIEVLNEQQAGLVLKALKGAVIYPVAAFALATGCRRGEIAALRWRDIDFENSVAKIEQSLEVTERGKRLRFKAPKTKHGRRNIALPSYIVSELRAHWKAQQEIRLSLGIGGASPDDLVFGTPEGLPMNPDVISRQWRQAVKSKKLPRVNFHALRHTHVSQLIAAGMDVLTISRRIGHSSPTITLAVYGHLFKNTDAKAAALIEAAFGAKTE